MKPVTPLRAIVSVLTLGTLVAACDVGEDCPGDGTCRDRRSGAGGAAGEGGDDAGAPAAPSCTVFGRAHLGLGGEDLASQAAGPASGDRGRAKPYSALSTEYARVLGSENAPALIARTGPTFGVPAARWYLEPIPSAVFVNTAFDVAFEGCLKMTGDLAGGTADSRYAATPTLESARQECAGWARRFWSREATPPQIDACSSVAVETTSETYGRPSVDEISRPTTPQRRWAYACASVLTATGFLTY
jgi:hypothetical protein